MTCSRPLVVVALALVLGACGSRTDLMPEPGRSLPVAPYGRADRPTAEELLERTPQAAPERSAELRKRSEEREDDPFDLPPEVGPRDMSEPPRQPGERCPDTADEAERVASCGRADRPG